MSNASALPLTRSDESTDINDVIADIEQRVFGSRFSEQASAYVPWRTHYRKFLELNELLEAGEKHCAFTTKRDILVGWARTLSIPGLGDDNDNGSDKDHLLNVNISGLAVNSHLPCGSGGGVVAEEINAVGDKTSASICSHIKNKHSQVCSIPGINQLSNYPDEFDVANEKCRLLVMHAQYIGELTTEIEILASLCKHSADHPIYEAAIGLESYFGGLIDSLCLKLKIIAADMHRTLYSPSTVKALEALHAILSAKEASLVKERATLDERLAIYREAGSEFQDIAIAHSDILKECDQIRRDIAQVSRL
ncbi:hypothetical protein GGI25_001792 [Coemansia spiralis]|uniref:Uncharacterized protein n=2 Tax=Coemansia TaxID=4863 RepID=A0A9W8G9U0_9FUNG|nr:hypothetical protein BX070DRAFT_252733 [Coemansia spiralis]KAJ1994002.1 hypothetical protein EDC05_001913 [Coemansia umbellata]KAJ2622768.1 hypothetical protein GGI26_003037 [Coemansia sp. RSA 1358]KAJ2679020.1 hypothetical protein GGI25_001792 [Coemansia spiralis]